MQKIVDFRQVKITSGSLEALKWLGVIFMTMDHANRFLFGDASYTVYCFGRIAMPLFTFVFAYNLAQPKPFSPEIYYKSIRRLIIFGLIATPAYMAMMRWQGLFPLNILFTFLVIALALMLFEENQIGFAVFSMVLGGFLVDYSWFGIILGFSFWLYCRDPSFPYLLLSGLACASLYVVNYNNWALLSIPIIYLASKIDIKIPRLRLLFWIYYPLHLTLLWLIQWLSWVL